MKTNRTTIRRSRPSPRTHNGAPAVDAGAVKQLERSVLACLLWEDSAYEDGVSISQRIKEQVAKVHPTKVAEIALRARTEQKLRHVPLLLTREMARLDSHKPFAAAAIESVVQRADELSEFLSLYWKDGKQPLSNQVKKGLAAAFTKFDEYTLAKYNNGDIKLRDVLFLVHPKPQDKAQAALWKRLANNELATPDTWEVALSAAGETGTSKRDVWTRLISEGKLGGLAFLRNLRNMKDAGVARSVILDGFKGLNVERVLPYRFITAARHAPEFEDTIEATMLKCLDGRKKVGGNTAILIDVSGSMDRQLSSKSDMTRLEAACALAILARETFKDVQVFTFSDRTVQVPARRGFALRDAIVKSQPHMSTYLGNAVRDLNLRGFDRTIVFTDEQSNDVVPRPVAKGYMINVANEKHGVGYRDWLHVDGFSEAVLDYILAYEAM